MFLDDRKVKFRIIVKHEINNDVNESSIRSKKES